MPLVELILSPQYCHPLITFPSTPFSSLFFVITFLHGSLWISLTTPSCFHFSFLFLFQFLAVAVPGPRIRDLLLVAEVPVSLAVTVPGVPYSCCSSCCRSPSFYPESQFCCTRRPSCFSSRRCTQSPNFSTRRCTWSPSFSTRHCTRSPSPPPSLAASRSGSSLQSEKRAICLLKYRTHRLRFKILRNNCLPYHLP